MAHQVKLLVDSWCWPTRPLLHTNCIHGEYLLYCQKLYAESAFKFAVSLIVFSDGIDAYRLHTENKLTDNQLRQL
jgi:hypothetical protein